MTKPHLPRTGIPPQRVDPSDMDVLNYWGKEFGVTFEQLLEAVKAVGEQPEEVREHFLKQGSSAGAS